MIEMKDSGVTRLKFKLVTGTSAKVQSTNAKDKIVMLKKVPLSSIPILLRGLDLLRQLPSILKASTPMFLQGPTCLGV